MRHYHIHPPLYRMGQFAVRTTGQTGVLDEPSQRGPAGHSPAGVDSQGRAEPSRWILVSCAGGEGTSCRA